MSVEKQQTREIDECPCCSGKLARECCLPILMGRSSAKTPLALMRSRYSAYALGGYVEYLFETWLPIRRSGLSVHELSVSNGKWSRLVILNKGQKGNEGFVEFNAYYLDDDFNEAIHNEKSLFKRVDGKWYYVAAI